MYFLRYQKAKLRFSSENSESPRLILFESPFFAGDSTLSLDSSFADRPGLGGILSPLSPPQISIKETRAVHFQKIRACVARDVLRLRSIERIIRKRDPRTKLLRAWKALGQRRCFSSRWPSWRGWRLVPLKSTRTCTTSAPCRNFSLATCVKGGPSYLPRYERRPISV